MSTTPIAAPRLLALIACVCSARVSSCGSFIECVIRDEGDGRDPPETPPPPAPTDGVDAGAGDNATEGDDLDAGTVDDHDGDMKAVGDDEAAGGVPEAGAAVHDDAQVAGYQAVWPPTGGSGDTGAQHAEGSAPAQTQRVLLPPIRPANGHAPSPPPRVQHGAGALTVPTAGAQGQGPCTGAVPEPDIDDLADAEAAAGLTRQLERQRAEVSRAQQEHAQLLLSYLYPRSDKSLAAEHEAFVANPALLLQPRPSSAEW